MRKVFQFYTEFNLPVMLGRKAITVYELLDGIKTVPDASIYYHTHRFLKQHHFLVPELPNDFAYWLRTVLNMRELGEVVSSVNIVECRNMQELRMKLIAVLEDFRFKDAYSFGCAPGYEFQFMSCRTVTFSLPNKASNLKEFAAILKDVSIYVFYYHMFESRLRRGRKENDFSQWFEQIGESELAQKVASLDPYTMTLEELRKKILTHITEYGKH
jgi:hypothetical protein